jgi:hypothetical protein
MLTPHSSRRARGHLQRGLIAGAAALLSVLLLVASYEVSRVSDPTATIYPVPATQPAQPSAPAQQPAPPTPATPAPAQPVPPAGAPAMPVTVPAGYTRAFTGDFDTPASPGQFDSVYGSEFGEYTGCCSTNGFTQYNPGIVLFVQNGSLYYDLHSLNGQSYAAAPQPWDEESFLYGQYGISLRLDSSTGPGYKIAFLLWPANGQWTNEVDFPEVNPDFNAPVRAVSLDTTTDGGAHVFSGTLDTGTYLTDGKYHVFLLTWTPTSMIASIDGHVVESFPANAIPHQPMRLSLQAEGWINQGPVPATTTDILQVRWVYINTLTGSPGISRGDTRSSTSRR